MHLMKHFRIGVIGTVVGLIVLLLASTGTRLGAQGNSLFADILARLGDITDTLNGLANPGRGPVVLSTPYIFMYADPGTLLTCPVSNVSSEFIVVRTRLFDPTGPALVFPGQENDATATVPAGLTAGSINVQSSRGGFLRCEWSFEGRPEDVRAAMLAQWADRTATVVPGY